MKKLSVLFAALCVSVAAFAAPIDVLVSEDVSYNDNIYLNKGKDKKESVISSTHAGLAYKGQLPESGLQLSAGGAVGYNAYTEKPGKNNFWDASANLGLENENLKVKNAFVFTSEPANSEQTDRVKRIGNNFSASYTTTHEKLFSVGITVGDIFNRYLASRMHGLNRNRVNAGARIYYNFTPKTNVFVEYMFGDTVYRKNTVNNSTAHKVGLGMNAQLASKLNGTAAITYDMRDYSHDKGNATNHPDLIGYYTSITWKATSRDTFTLSGSRDMEETTFGDNRFFADTLVGLTMRHQFNSKWGTGLLLGWEELRYKVKVNNRKRADELLTVRPEINYAFQDWLVGSIWYQYRTRNSNMDNYDYDNNKAGIMIRAIF